MGRQHEAIGGVRAASSLRVLVELHHISYHFITQMALMELKGSGIRDVHPL